MFDIQTWELLCSCSSRFALGIATAVCMGLVKPQWIIHAGRGSPLFNANCGQCYRSHSKLSRVEVNPHCSYVDENDEAAVVVLFFGSGIAVFCIVI